MIDEKKLIAEIRNLKKHYDFFYKEGRSEIDDTVKGASDTLFNDIAEIIYKQPKIVEWIPCSERLPEEDGIYIIDDREFNSPWVHTAGFKVSSKSWNDVYERYEDGTVIAWQPLPEPWKGEV